MSVNSYIFNHFFNLLLTLLSISLQVLFVCTANVVENIPNPLLDRMEVIAIAGYITDEKMHIARDYLEKTTREACGIKPEQVLIPSLVNLCVWENRTHLSDIWTRGCSYWHLIASCSTEMFIDIFCINRGMFIIL